MKKADANLESQTVRLSFKEEEDRDSRPIGTDSAWTWRCIRRGRLNLFANHSVY